MMNFLVWIATSTFANVLWNGVRSFVRTEDDTKGSKGCRGQTGVHEWTNISAAF
jgi:hypothetical protein